MKPSIGRVVHYCATGKEPAVYAPCQHFDAFDKITHNSSHPTLVKEGESYAAVVTAAFVEDDVTATIHLPGGGLLSVRCPYAENPTPGHWSWPPRV